MIAHTSNPQPGIFRGVPMDEYLRIDAVGSSTLAHMSRSAAYSKYRRDAEYDSTEAMRSGSLLHAMLLEPETVATRFVPGGQCEALLKSGPRKGQPCGCSAIWYVVEEGESEAYCGKHSSNDLATDPRMCVSASEWESDELLAKRMHDHPDIGPVLAAAEDVELTLVWQDPNTGVFCKARPDVVTADCIADVKRNVKAHPDAWPWEVNRRGYHIQAAHYLDGARVLGMARPRWRWLLADSTAPHEVWAPWCSEETLVVGLDHRNEALGRHLTCSQRDYWPGYPTGDIETGLPVKIIEASMADGEVAEFSATEGE